MIVTLDTTFLVLHYFSKDSEVLKKSRLVLHHCKLAGNRGLLPTLVTAEFYAIARKTAGREVAEARFSELSDSGLQLVYMTSDVARESGILRSKYQEKIPWGDCIIAGTHLVERGNVVISEDPHFKQIKEIRASKLGEFKLP